MPVLALIQRVTRASVECEGETLGQIGHGLMVLVGVERGDAEAGAERLRERVCGYRIFADAEGRMNLSVTDVGGELLLVPQFTLPADTRKGMRPGLSPAADPEVGKRLFEHFVESVRRAGHRPRTGRFGSHMLVHLSNDGPATFMLRVPPAARI